MKPHPEPASRVSSSVALLLAAASLAACASPRAVMRAARAEVERVRPGVDLSDVSLVVWRDDAQLAPLYAEEVELLSHPFARRILRAHQVLFERLRLVEPGELPLEPLVGDSPAQPAFVLPTSAVTVARPGAALSIDTLAHEYGHHVSYRRGYWENAKRWYCLHPEHPGRAEWIDLDAFLAAWAIEEGVAVVTEGVATGEGDEMWRLRRSFAPGAATDRASYPLYPRVRAFAYGDGPRAVLVDGFDSLEAGFAATWARFRGTTREVLHPDEDPRPSALAEWFRGSVASLDPAPVAATRVGTLFLLQAISERYGRWGEPAGEIVEPCLDDLFLSYGPDEQVWITDWRELEAAARFVEELRAIAPEADVTVEGARVWVTWGDRGAELRRALATRLP